MAASIAGNISMTPNGLQYLAGNLSNGQSQLIASSTSFNFASFGLTYGTGTVLSNGLIQVNDWYLNTLTIAASGTYSINLNGGSDTNPFGTALAFTKVKLIVVSLSVIDYNANFVQVGPQGVANAAALGFGGTGATAYWTVYSTMVFPGSASGWVVNNTTASLLPIVNNSAGSLNVQVFIAGTK